MRSIQLENNTTIDETIFEKHITSYIYGMGLIITGAFIFLFIADAVISILVNFGYFPFHLQSIFGGTASYKEFLIGQIIIQFSTFIPFLIYYLLLHRVNFSQKKTLLCFLTISTTAILCFGHWKNPYISFLFSIPVVVTSPLDKKRNRITLIISEAFIILYAFFHNKFHPSNNNYLVLAISTTTIAMFFVVSLRIHTTMNGVFKEVKEYKNMQEVLYDKIAHDVLTGALSKSALEADMENLSQYKSMAFLDIDNFKNINDENGHHTGDGILKLLVICLKSKFLDIYRYGGDEFVILSKVHNAKELENIIKVNKNRLFFTSKELYSCEITLSVGIINININHTPSQNIQKADKLMYMSKETGKNSITTEEN